MISKHYSEHETPAHSHPRTEQYAQSGVELSDTHDSGMTFFIHYVGICVLLVLAMASVLDPYAVLIGVAMAFGIGLSVWLTSSLAEMVNEYLQSGE